MILKCRLRCLRVRMKEVGGDYEEYDINRSLLLLAEDSRRYKDTCDWFINKNDESID